MDANLVAAVMLQESGGNSKAYSTSGAVGLMQVMPRDGLAAKFQCAGKPCFASRPSMTELYDPDFNVSYGVRMLAGLVQKTGSTREALRSYGPMDVGYYYADKVLRIYQNYQ
jgi:soluble lytic murein transglycosylase-like protein